MFHTTRKIAWIFALGIVTGGYGVHQLEAAPLLKLVAGGACVNPAFQAVLIVGYGIYNCQDTIIANAIQIHDAQAADPIGDIIRATDNVGKAKKTRK